MKKIAGEIQVQDVKSLNIDSGYSDLDNTEKPSGSQVDDDPIVITDKVSSKVIRSSSMAISRDRSLLLLQRFGGEKVILDAILKRGNEPRRQLIKAPDSPHKMDWYALTCFICGLINHSLLSSQSEASGLILVGVDPKTRRIRGLKMERRERDLFLQTLDNQLMSCKGFLQPRLMMHNILNISMLTILDAHGDDCGRRLLHIEVRSIRKCPSKNASLPNFYVMKSGKYKDVAFTRRIDDGALITLETLSL